MSEEEQQFGVLLKRLIKEAGLTQEAFYKEAGIAKPYFYNILKGSPPPPVQQRKFMELLHPSPGDAQRFYDLSARLRNELPADIQLAVAASPALVGSIRSLIETMKEEHDHE